jgi:hypothetical protein
MERRRFLNLLWGIPFGLGMTKLLGCHFGGGQKTSIFVFEIYGGKTADTNGTLLQMFKPAEIELYYGYKEGIFVSRVQNFQNMDLEFFVNHKPIEVPVDQQQIKSGDTIEWGMFWEIEEEEILQEHNEIIFLDENLAQIKAPAKWKKKKKKKAC